MRRLAIAVVVAGISAPLVAQPASVGAARVIPTENARPGTTDWLLTNSEEVAAATRDDRYRRQRAIEGYVSHTSLRPGQELTAYVSVDPPGPYRVDVFRMGYYGGKGARLVKSLGPLEGSRQREPVEGAQQLVEARWRPSFRLGIGNDWPSGVYLAKLKTLGSAHESYLVWVVRDDRKADLMFQVSDLTWQAYNRWPAWRSLYDWKDERWHTTPGAKVGFDRPYSFYYNLLPSMVTPASNGSGEFLLWEFPLAYWLEENGYDVTYVSNLDTDADRDGLVRAKGFLSVGHDEYWTRRMFDNVSWARDQGVSVAFLSGNAVDGEVVLGPSSDGRSARVFERFPGRGYDDDMSDEQLLMGATSYGVGLGDWRIARADHWLLDGTGMKEGDVIPGLVGWEYHGPPLRDDPTLEVVASGKVFDNRGREQEHEFAATLYAGPRGNVVFNAATCWWNMLLSAPPGFVNPNNKDFARPDPRVRRITQNLLARMIAGAPAAPAPRQQERDTLAGHPVSLDAGGRLLSWVEQKDAAYPTVVRLAFERLLTGFPVEDNGQPTWLTYCCFDGQSLRGGSWPHNPASFYAGLTQGAALYYAYTGDRRVIELVKRVLDYQLANGTTPSDPAWAWPSVPYASADHGALVYRGAHDFRYASPNDPPKLGRGDGYGVIEPDKVGELGLAYLVAWQLTGDARYREAALAGARALARNVRAGDATRSPWPFRVVAETGFVREEYGSNLAPTLRLFDELARLGLGDVDAWRRARQTAWGWVLAHPLKTDAWANYFEDVPALEKPSNLTQYTAGEMARYLLEHPDRDPAWREHASRLIAWIESTFGVDTPREKGVQWGAAAISEQLEYMYKMGSHTARFASLLALWHDRTGDALALEKAFRSFNWASYMCDRRGVVRVGPVESSHWFSDGYGDYIRHFMVGLGAVPAWSAPGEDQLLRSSSIVTDVVYAPGEVRYRTFDDAGEERLRLSFVPRTVSADGVELTTGWSFDPHTRVLQIRRQGARAVAIR